MSLAEVVRPDPRETRELRDRMIRVCITEDAIRVQWDVARVFAAERTVTIELTQDDLVGKGSQNLLDELLDLVSHLADLTHDEAVKDVNIGTTSIFVLP